MSQIAVGSFQFDMPPLFMFQWMILKRPQNLFRKAIKFRQDLCLNGYARNNLKFLLKYPLSGNERESAYGVITQFSGPSNYFT